ncbi:MAG: NAD(P)(+) transhydrogenase (Re/Si-specific) subunit alpha, partial [Actinobacteria bacterium]|nr:NAD(P)(+) transhydrogenase (Re/Si-specific) subunit alpha [Actinomycetota bacterium]
PATMPEHASELYARNVAALLELMVDEKGRLTPDSEDEVLVRSCVTREREGDNG